MLTNEGLELPDQSRVLTQRELRVDPLLENSQSRFLQPRDLRLRERLVGKFGKRWATPQPQCLPQPGGRTLRIALMKCPAAFLHERLEAANVDLTRLGLQQIAAPAADQQPLPEHLTQVRDISLDDLGRARGRPFPPKRVDQPI